MNKNGVFQSWVFEHTVTTATVVTCIDRFVLTLERPTVLVVDNAPIHTSHEFKDNIDRWKEQKLTVLPIASYSPEQNLIEILPAHRCAAPASPKAPTVGALPPASIQVVAENKVRVEPFLLTTLFCLSSKTYSIFSPISAKITASNSLEAMLKDFCTTT